MIVVKVECGEFLYEAVRKFVRTKIYESIS